MKLIKSFLCDYIQIYKNGDEYFTKRLEDNDILTVLEEYEGAGDYVKDRYKRALKQYTPKYEKEYWRKLQNGVYEEVDNAILFGAVKKIFN